ncbi:MAG: hypothetical protein ACE5G8_02780, partial [Anaerolineae bacterium]
MNRFKTLIWLSLPLALATLLLAVSAMALPVYAQGGSISGQVFSPVVGSLLPPTGTVVRLFKPGSDVVVGQANVDSNTGAFSFPTVDDGLYVLQAVPPSNSGLTPSRPKTAFVSGSPVTGVRLLLTKPQVFGAVFAPTGSPADATVSVYKLHHKIQQTATSGGRFWLGGLLAGDYTLRATPTGSDPYWNSNPYTLTVTASPNATYTVNLTLTNADLWGAAVDGLGNPVAGAFVAAAQQSGAHRADVSNAGGAWSLGDLPGGEYVLAVIPPSNRPELLAPLPITVTLPGAANPFTFTFQTTQKQAHGTVRTNTGAAVQNALVVARRINRVGLAEALTTITGSYRLNLSPGLWALTVKPVSSTVPGDWIYPGAPAILHFPRDTVPQTRQQDFTVLTADAAVSGTVLLPGGDPQGQGVMVLL